jgi:hemerythrin-like metal-binding protein
VWRPTILFSSVGMTAHVPAELAVGFEEIDGQHRGLLDGIERVVASLDRGVPGLRAAVAALNDLFVAHFAAEEAFMDASGYPDRGKHRSAHDLFMQDFARQARELGQLGLTPPVREWVVNGLPEWTRFHIRVNDVPLGRYLRARRLAPELAGASDKPRAS